MLDKISSISWISLFLIKDSVNLGFNKIHKLTEIKYVLSRVANEIWIYGSGCEIVFAKLPVVEYSLELSLQRVDAMSHLVLAKYIIQAWSHCVLDFMQLFVLMELSHLSECHV